MIVIRLLTRLFLVSLFMAFGTVAVFAAPGDWTRVSYPVQAQEFCALPVDLTNAARAPPPTSADVMATGTAFAQTGTLRAFDGPETIGAVYAHLRSPTAPNRVTNALNDPNWIPDPSITDPYIP